MVEIHTSLENLSRGPRFIVSGLGIINKSIGDISRGRYAGFPLQSVDEDAFEYGSLNGDGSTTRFIVSTTKTRYFATV